MSININIIVDNTHDCHKIVMKQIEQKQTLAIGLVQIPHADNDDGIIAILRAHF